MQKKIFREKKKQLVREHALTQEKCIGAKTAQMLKFPELKKISLELNTAEIFLPDLEELQEKCEQVSRCNYIALFQRVDEKTNLEHFFQVNETVTSSPAHLFAIRRRPNSFFYFL